MQFKKGKIQKDSPSTIKQLSSTYQNKQKHFDPHLLQLSNSKQLTLIINELNILESKDGVRNNLQLILQISKRQEVCLLIYSKLSIQLTAIYWSLLQKQILPIDQQNVRLIDAIFGNIIQCHIHKLFVDQIEEGELNFYDHLVSMLDLHLENGYSEERSLLLELILEYFQINKINWQEPAKKLLMKQGRKQSIGYFIDQNNGAGMGSIFSELLALNQDASYDSALWLRHKQNLIYNLKNKHQNTLYLKFIRGYLRVCESTVFNEHKLQDILQAIIKLLEQQMSDMNPYSMIIGNKQAGTLKLRKIKYYSQILQSLNANHLLKVSNSILYEQEEIIVKLLINLLYYRQSFNDQQLKKRYLQQIILTMTTTLPVLYRYNYFELIIHGQDLIQYFPKLMEIQANQIKIGICEIMRALLLKKEIMMANCQSLAVCQQYIEWLPLQAQEHVVACGRIQQLLFEDKSIEQEYCLYFKTSNDHSKLINPELQANPINTQRYQQDAQSSISTNASSNILNKQKPAISSQQLPWTEDQLLYSLKNIYNSDSTQDIKTTIDHLVFLQKSQYASILIDIFLDSEQLLQKDSSKSPADLSLIQKKLIEHIPEICISFDNKFYQMMALNEIGASICLKKRGIGLRGLQILCIKFMKQQQITKYAQMISVNALELEQLKYLYNCKIYKIVNKKLPLNMKNDPLVMAFLKLITATCKLKSFQDQYQVRQLLIKYLMENALSLEMIKAVLQALIQLTNDCAENRKIMQNTAIVSFLGDFIKEQENFGEVHEIHMLIYELLANLLQYNATAALQYSQIYLQGRIVQKLKNQLLNNSYYVNHFKALLKLLEVLSLAPLSCIRLLKTNFISVCISIAKQAINNQCYLIIKTTLMIIYHLIESISPTLEKSINQLDQESLLQYLYSIIGIISEANSTEIYLQIVGQILNVPSIVQKITSGKMEILKVLSQISKSKECNIVIFQKWTRILYLLLEGSHFNFTTDIINNNTFYEAVSYLCNHTSLTQATINMNMIIIRQISNLQISPKVLVKHGFVDFSIMNLRMKNLQLNDYLIILGILIKVQKKAAFSVNLNSKLFEIVIRKLEFNWENEVSGISLALLKIIKKNLDITHQFGQSLFQFFGSFLTQSSRVNSSKYFAISKEVINLMSYCINFHEPMKICFKTNIIVTILKNWLRVLKSQTFQDIQVYKLFIYSIYNEEALLVDISQISKDKMGKIENVCDLGWKCSLYRMNGSFKECGLRFDINQQQLIAFKWPSGEIKTKYSLPLKDIIIVYSYKNEKDVPFQESYFTRSSNLFQKSVNHTRCITIMCLCEESNEIRQISVQFQNMNDLKVMTSYLRILITRSSQFHKQKLVQFPQTNKRTDIPL